MKNTRSLFAALTAAFVLVCSALAADASGTWKWTTEGRNGPMESTAKLTVKDGALSGTVSGRMGDVAIADASLKEDQIAFSVTREFNGNSFVIKYAGKVEGDTITGTIERPDRNGGTTKVEWRAARVK